MFRKLFLIILIATFFGHAKLIYSGEIENSSSGFYLITALYNEPNINRINEYLECLNRNLENPYIKKIYVLYDTTKDDSKNILLKSLHEKRIDIIYTKDRQTYADCFRLANILPEESRVIVSNADIYFNNTLQFLLDYDLTNKFLALTRWQVKPDGSITPYKSQYSQDTWIFKVPLRSFKNDQIALGIPGCDNKIARQADTSGLEVLNPSQTIQCCHLHLSGVHNYIKDLSVLASIGGEFMGVPLSTLRSDKRLKNITEKTEAIFSQILHTNAWNDKESVSGTGSNLQQTATIRKEIPKLLKAVKTKTLLDAPCGDFYWMQHTDLSLLDMYIGADIVPDIIKKYCEKFSNEKRTFIVRDIISDELPQVDTILCRDCLVHLSYENIFKAIKNLKKSKSTYLLTTTFTSRKENKDIPTGKWRPINLQITPFNFPAPIMVINEECTQFNNKFTDKCLGLWRLEDLPDYD